MKFMHKSLMGLSSANRPLNVISFRKSDSFQPHILSDFLLEATNEVFNETLSLTFRHLTENNFPVFSRNENREKAGYIVLIIMVIVISSENGRYFCKKISNWCHLKSFCCSYSNICSILIKKDFFYDCCLKMHFFW